MNKKALTETDIRSKFITPALCGEGGVGWDLMTQIREEAYFTKGRVIVRGKVVQRGEAKKADYLLYYKPNLPIAVIEAKDNHHTVGARNTTVQVTAMSDEWLTYEEVAERLAVTPRAARARAFRGRWAKTMGNDGRARVRPI